MSSLILEPVPSGRLPGCGRILSHDNCPVLNGSHASNRWQMYRCASSRLARSPGPHALELFGRDGLQRILLRIDRLVRQTAVLVLQVLPAVPVEPAGRSQRRPA